MSGGAGAGGPDASGPGDASANADGSPVGGGTGPCKLPLDGFKFNGKALEPSVFVARREGKLVGLGCSGTTAAPGFLAVYRFDCTTAEVTETRTALPCGSPPEESYAGFGRPLTARDTWLVSHNTYDKSTSPPEQREATVEVNLKGEVGFRIPRPVLADGEGKLWALPNNGATGGVVNKSAEVYAPDGTPLTLSAASRARQWRLRCAPRLWLGRSFCARPSTPREVSVRTCHPQPRCHGVCSLRSRSCTE